MSVWPLVWKDLGHCYTLKWKWKTSIFMLKGKDLEQALSHLLVICHLPPAMHSKQSLQIIPKGLQTLWNSRLNFVDINILDSIVFYSSGVGICVAHHHPDSNMNAHPISMDWGPSCHHIWIAPDILWEPRCVSRDDSASWEKQSVALYRSRTVSDEWQNPSLYCTAKDVMQGVPSNGNCLSCCFSHALITLWLLGSNVLVSWMGNVVFSWNLTNWERINKEASFSTHGLL